MALAVLAVLLLAPGAEAAETDTFRFDPHPVERDGERRRYFDLDAPVGATVRESAVLVNKTDEPKRYRLYVVDATEDEHGRIHVGDANEPVREVGTWVGLEPSVVTVQPRAGQVIEFTLERRSEAGGLAAIVAEELVEGAEAGLDVVLRIALLVDARGEPDGTTGLVVGPPQLESRNALLPRQAQVLVPVSNETTQRVTASLDVSLQSLTGRRFDLPRSELTLEPGGSQLVTIPWQSVPGVPSVITANAEATWSGPAVVAQSGRMVVLPLWAPTLLVLFASSLAWRERQYLVDLVS